MKRNGTFIVIGSITLSAVTWFLIRHMHDLDISRTNFAIGYTLMFGYLALNVIASLASKPHERDEDFDYSQLGVDVFVPVYNEDSGLLAAGLRSLSGQTRLPDCIWLVDDGSTDPALQPAVVAGAIEDCRSNGIAVHTHRQENQGKRHAQAFGFMQSSADVFVTVDSDTILESDALEQLLLAFSKPETQSVGGMAVGQNHKQSLLTRTIELGFVMAFLSGRLAEGHFGAVRVNCGILAAYRGDVVRMNIHRYLNQKWLGQPVTIGDDRALTIFALERGRAEFQSSAVAYSALPTRISHLVRQRLRWARSWYWGTLWLLRRPVRSAEFWFTALQVLSMISYLISMGFALLGTSLTEIHPRFLMWTAATSVAIGAMSTLRYVAAGRPDEKVWDRALTWLLSPLSSLLYLFVLVPLYWYAGLFMRSKGWGTRKVVEVGLRSEIRDAA